MKSPLSVLLLSLILLTVNAQVPDDQLTKLSAQISQEPGNINLYDQRASLYTSAKETTKALADYKKVLELYKANPAGKDAQMVATAYYRVSEGTWRGGKPLDALDLIDNALKLKPDEKTYLLHQARVLASMPSRENEAMQKFDNLVVRFPDDEKLLLEYAKFVMPKDAGKGVVLYEKVLRLNIMNKYALKGLGDFYSETAPLLSDTQMAETYREKAIGYYELLSRIDPEDKAVTKSLERLKSTQN